jgi:hypothetical protein
MNANGQTTIEEVTKAVDGHWGLRRKVTLYRCAFAAANHRVPGGQRS